MRHLSSLPSPTTKLHPDLGANLRVVRLDSAKDVSDLHVADPSAFAERFKEALSQAAPYSAAAELSPEEVQEALALLRGPALFKRIGQDLEAIGVVGEETPRLLVYMNATSREMKRTLGSALRSPSAYGKTHLVSKVRELMPEDEVAEASRLTPQALPYGEEGGLQGKWLIVSDIATSEGMPSACFSATGRYESTILPRTQRVG